MPPPLAIICEICGGKFSKHSLVIHQKACVAKREASTSFCPVCDCLVSNDEYGSHVSECKRVNGQAAADAKKAVAAAKAKAAKADKAKSGSAGKPGEGLSVVGNDKSAAAEAAAASAAAAATAKPQQRSKIPESVLKRLAGTANGEKQLTPEQRLQKCLGVDPCLACGGPKAAVACMGCHAVYCKPCSDMIHECNKALADHKPFVKEDIVADAPAEVVDHREECPICERRFDAGKIARHRLVCTKQSQKKPRKAFKSAREQRMKGTDLEKYIKQVDKPAPEAPSRWRAQHESIMRMAGVDKAEDEAALTAAIEKAKGSGDPVARLKAEKELAEHRAALAAAAPAASGAVEPPSAGAVAASGEASVAPSPGSVGTAATSASSVSAGAVSADAAGATPPSAGMATPTKGGPGAGGAGERGAEADTAGGLDSSMLSAGGSRKPRSLQVGDKVVLVDRGVWGVIQYKGPVWGLKPKGTWFGVEFFDAPHGKGDGSYQGTPYFYTKQGFASFLLPEKVRRFIDGEVLKAGQPAHEATMADGSKVAPQAALPSQAQAPVVVAAVAVAAPAAAQSSTAGRPVSQQSSKGDASSRTVPPAAAATQAAAVGASAASNKPWMKKQGSEGGAPVATPAPAVASTGSRAAPTGREEAVKVAAAISKSVIAPGMAPSTTPAAPAAASTTTATSSSKIASPVGKTVAAPSSSSGAGAQGGSASRPTSAKAVGPASLAQARPGSASKGVTGIPSPGKSPRPGSAGLSAAAGAASAVPAVSPRQPSTLTRVGSRIPAPAAKQEAAPAPAPVATPAAAPIEEASTAPGTAAGGGGLAAGGSGVTKLVGASSAKPWLNKLKAKMEAAGGVAAVAAVVAAQQASKSPGKEQAGPALLRAASSPDVVQHQREVSTSEAPSTAPAGDATPVSAVVAPTPAPAPAPSARPASASASSSAAASAASPPPKFNASLVSKLRAKVEGERAPAGAAQAAAGGKQPGRLVAEVKAKQAAAAAAASSSVSKPASPASRPASAASGAGGVASSKAAAGGPGSGPQHVSLEEQRRRDIARNVDFLRVLNGEKSTLAADPGDGSGRGSFYAFAGSGHKLGGGSSENSGPPEFKGPVGTLGADGKRRVVVDGKVQLAKGATDTKSEREKRAAAALARVSANVSQSAPVSGDKAAHPATGDSGQEASQS